MHGELRIWHIKLGVLPQLDIVAPTLSHSVLDSSSNPASPSDNMHAQQILAGFAAFAAVATALPTESEFVPGLPPNLPLSVLKANL